MRLKGAWIAFILSLSVFAALVGILLLDTAPAEGPGGPVVLYCAAGMRLPVEAAARSYGGSIRFQYGGSQTLLANAEVSGSGDLYLPADDSYVEVARKKDLIREVLPLARVRPVLAVRRGNPSGIRSVADLLRPGARLVQANPDATAVGKLTRDALRKKGLWEQVEKGTLAFKPTVNDVANDLKLGAADAGFVWDATVKQYPDLEAVPVPELAGVAGSVSVAVLRTAKNPAAALRFARYLAASDRGLKEFAAHGFEPVEGDPWEEKPNLLFYGGGMLRPAVESTLTAFETREGVSVTRVYNGCGILVGQMKAGARPDVYFACDPSFMDQVKPLFHEPRDVSINQLVIMVHKGNPHGIKTLRDLGKQGIKIGVGHEKQCALGALTAETLVQTKLYGEVMKNVAVQSPTGDLLVNQLRVKSLDAVIAYVSNMTRAPELEGYPVDVPCALAVQPVAVGKESRHKLLAGRLVHALRSVESRQQFETEGFRWKGTP